MRRARSRRWTGPRRSCRCCPAHRSARPTTKSAQAPPASTPPRTSPPARSSAGCTGAIARSSLRSSCRPSTESSPPSSTSTSSWTTAPPTRPRPSRPDRLAECASNRGSSRKPLQGGASAGRYIVTTLPSWAHSNAASDWRESMSGCGGEGVRSQSSRAVGQHCGLVQMEGNRATRVAGPRIDRPPLRGR